MLIIDQPEETRSQVDFDELVSLFVAAKAKRQVSIVTHNANLLINTDADQIIVACAGPLGQCPLAFNGKNAAVPPGPGKMWG
ncbi:hypothetical protein ICI42_22435 [Tianweitania sp. Rool2]|uniref:ATPase AAA-type core domain-containing protein n=1 Tax=Oryzicola mucosus TaxID=2767425 RepID=A0A8J6U3V6_9HYPH|nr:hypothetical protein [Oryzicola mucosus]MBD0417403.1 hypothetical protein [Oryzicola mucosus]